MKIAEFCAGYNGLGMAVEEVFGAEPGWFSEYDAAPSKILAHHYPGIRNYGDMTKIKWAPDCPDCGSMCAVYRHKDDSPYYWCSKCSAAWDISIRHDDPDADRIPEPADIHSGGTPCQDLSAAGKRRGMTEGTRSNLWVQMREAIAIQRPRYVVWENVRGAYSATAASDLEQCPGCMGDTTDGGAVLRALGRVLGDLSDLGYDTQWRGLRAADVGAPHGRFRVFVLAAHRDHLGINGAGERAEQDWRGQSAHGGNAASIPTSIRGREGWTEHARKQGRPDAFKRGASTATNSDGRHDAGWQQDQERGAFRGVAAEWSSGSDIDWGQYNAAIRRWEAMRGTAPAPTELTSKGVHRLSARFAEWLMGVPAGWITDVPGISRNDQLKACGNGVVPQQAKAALTDMLHAFQAKDIAA